MRGPAAVAVLAVVWACSRPHAEGDVTGDAATGSPGRGAEKGPSAAIAADAVGRAADGAGAARTVGHATGTANWRGSYKSTSGELYIPPEWKNVHWNVKESTAGLGEGAMTLSIDPASGRAIGSLDGPLGPATVDGLVSEGRLTATIARKEPSDQGFTGTLIGSIGGDRAEGTMNLSVAEASAVRKATFALAPETSGAAQH